MYNSMISCKLPLQWKNIFKCYKSLPFSFRSLLDSMGLAWFLLSLSFLHTIPYISPLSLSNSWWSLFSLIAAHMFVHTHIFPNTLVQPAQSVDCDLYACFQSDHLELDNQPVGVLFLGEDYFSQAKRSFAACGSLCMVFLPSMLACLLLLSLSAHIWASHMGETLWV